MLISETLLNWNRLIGLIMPLNQEQIHKIKTIFKLESFEGSHSAMLGAALRRAAILKKPPNGEWNEYIELIWAILVELHALDPNEISRSNNKGFTALQYAIASLIEYSKSENLSPEEIFCRLRLITIIANFLEPEELEVDFSKKRSEKYKANPSQIYIDSFNPDGLASIPMADQMIVAIEIILIAYKNMKNAYKELVDAMQTMTNEEIAALPQPIIFLTAHYDLGQLEFLNKYAATIMAQKYKLLCMELPTGYDVTEYVNQEYLVESLPGIRFSYEGSEKTKVRLNIDTILAMQRAKGHVEFVDAEPASQAHETNLQRQIAIKYGLVDSLMLAPRNFGIAYSTLKHCIKYKCGAILVVGLLHHHGLQDAFSSKLNINPRFTILTKNTEELLALLKSVSTPECNLVTELRGITDAGVDIFDLSKGDDLTKLGLTVSEPKRSSSPVFM